MRTWLSRIGIFMFAVLTFVTVAVSCSSDDKDEETPMYVFKIRDASTAFNSNPLLAFTVQSICVRQYDEGVSYFQTSDKDAATAKFRRAVSQINAYDWDSEFTLSAQTYFTLQLVTGNTVVASEIINLK